MEALSRSQPDPTDASSGVAGTDSSQTDSPQLIEFARGVIRHEAAALHQLADQLDAEFTACVDLLASCQGAVIVTGIGKAGLIGQKLSATFCSTGTTSHFLHPAEAMHGDLGRVGQRDIVLALSKSGETEELTRVLPALGKLAACIVSITGSRKNTLGRASRHVLELGPLDEADALGLAPSTSTTAMLAVGDALALSLSRQRGFQDAHFARYHPGGSLGRKLTPVREMMRPLDQCRLAQESASIRDTFITLRQANRRTGAVMLVDDAGRLTGLFTDSDLARLLERSAGTDLDRAVRDVMTTRPIAIAADAMMPAAVQLLASNQISELPVLDTHGKPVGLIDITDVIGWLPLDSPTAADELADGANYNAAERSAADQTAADSDTAQAQQPADGYLKLHRPEGSHEA